MYSCERCYKLFDRGQLVQLSPISSLSCPRCGGACQYESLSDETYQKPPKSLEFIELDNSKLKFCLYGKWIEEEITFEEGMKKYPHDDYVWIKVV